MEMMRATITIVGCGPGSPDYLVPAGCKAIEQAEVLVGTARLLEMFPQSKAQRMVVGGDIPNVLDGMSSHVGKKSIAVLVTGDPGLFSLSKKVIQRFGRDVCRVIPGISSVQTAFACVGESWEDARIVSLHNGAENFHDDLLLKERKIALLTGNETSRHAMEKFLNQIVKTHNLFLCQDLTLREEKIEKLVDFGKIRLPSRSVILAIHHEDFL